MSKVSFLLSWRTLALTLAIINLKALPFSWHLRLFYRMFRNWHRLSSVQQALRAHSESDSTHPIFAPVSIFSRTPLLETDYNLHKSNSTYFSDLDESRTALVTKIYGPGLKQGDKNLAREGHKGHISVILGSVHTSFHKEIKPYEKYELRSRILTWDRKWLVIATFFIRPAANGKEEVLLASALSKYVVKKGRFTVSPERCLTTAGWLPPKPADCVSGAGQSWESSASDTPVLVEPAMGSSPASRTPEPEGVVAPTPEGAADATSAGVEKLESAIKSAAVERSNAVLPLTGRGAGGWDWHRIEMERVRGLQLAANWLALDKELMGEFGHR